MTILLYSVISRSCYTAVYDGISFYTAVLMILYSATPHYMTIMLHHRMTVVPVLQLNCVRSQQGGQ